MPRRKRSSPPVTAPGIAVQHLQQNFSEIAASPALLVGHVLYAYIQHGRNSAETARRLQPALPHVPQDSLRTRIARLAKAALETDFKKLSDPREFAAFDARCKSAFTVAVNTTPSVASKPPPTTLSDESPKPISPIKTRNSCSQCPVVKRQLGAALREKIALRQQLKGKNKKSSLRVLNQKLKRRGDTITDLKSSLKSLSTDKEKTQLKRKLWRMSSYRRKKRKDDSPGVSVDEFVALQQKNEEMAEEIRTLQHEKMVLEEVLEESRKGEEETKLDKKAYNSQMRMMVYEAIVNQVPTENIHPLIKNFALRFGISLSSVPSRSTIETMVRELGVLSDYQSCSIMLRESDLTLAFDATTQEGRHLNAIQVTTPAQCLVIGVDELPGGTANDYAAHIDSCFNSLAETYSTFTGAKVEEVKEKLVKNTSNTMTDRCAANHAAIAILEKKWGKQLNELYCHLHPLDSMSTVVRTAMKANEGSNISHALFGKDCIAGNVVLAINKLRWVKNIVQYSYYLRICF